MPVGVTSTSVMTMAQYKKQNAKEQRQQKAAHKQWMKKLKKLFRW